MKKLDYYIIGILLCIYGLNDYIDICICVVLCAFLFKNIRNEKLEFLYFGLMFFEPILVLPFVGGSFFRIYEIIFFIKVIFDIKDNKAKLRMTKFNVLSVLFIIITGFMYQEISDQISLIINVLMMTYIICKKYKKNGFYEELLYSIGVLIAFTAIYGFFRGNILNYGAFARMATTISDPNYAALFLNIGVFSLLGNQKCAITEKRILLTVLGISLLLTVSLTGICGCLMFVIIYCFLNNLKKGLKYTFFLLILVIVFICAPIKQGNMLYGLHQRLLNIEDSSVDDISSGRTVLLKKYLNNFNKLPIKQFLIGGNNTIKGEYRKFVKKEFSNVSHNSYIDILYMIGVIGLGIFIIIYIYGITELYNYYKMQEQVSINLILLKLILLYFAFTLSLFPYRYFIAIYLLNIPQKEIGEIEINESTMDSKHNISISV